MQQHLGKTGVVPDGGEKSAAAALEIRFFLRIPQLFGRHAFIDVVQRGDPAELFLRDEESGILHAQRIKDVFLQVFPEGFAGKHLDHGAEHVDGESVHPLFPGFKSQRQAANEVDIFHGAGEGLAGVLPFLYRFSLDPAGSGILPVVGNAAGHGEELAQGDPALRVRDFIRTVRVFLRDFRVFEPRQVFADGIPHFEQALFIEPHDAGDRHDLGHGSNGENRFFRGHGDLVFDVRAAEAV